MLNGRTTQCFGVLSEYGFMYNKVNGVEQKAIVGVDEYANKSFSKYLDLEPGTYYYRTFATNGKGTGFGTQMSFTVKARSAGADITVNLDGSNLEFDVPPMVDSGRTLVPLRAVFEALGAKVEWDAATQTVKAVKGETEISLVIDGQATKDGEVVPLDVPASIVQGRTLVPLRFVSEAMGSQVDWYPTTRTVIIATPAQ